MAAITRESVRGEIEQDFANVILICLSSSRSCCVTKYCLKIPNGCMSLKLRACLCQGLGILEKKKKEQIFLTLKTSNKIHILHSFDSLQ